MEKIFEPILDADEKQMQYILDTLKDKYYSGNSGIVLVQNSDIISFTTSKEQAEIVTNALAIKKNSPLSNAAMETLAIIAYNQPVSRAFIEQVRGVDSTSSVQTLLSRNLIEEAGRLEIPGRPLSYKTTATFLRSFSLTSLADLPKVKADKEEGQLSTDDLTVEEAYNEFND